MKNYYVNAKITEAGSEPITIRDGWPSADTEQYMIICLPIAESDRFFETDSRKSDEGGLSQ